MTAFLQFTDPEGDPVLVDPRWICSVRVGKVPGQSQTVTLIRTIGGTDVVREPIGAVLSAITEAATEAHARHTEAMQAYPGLIGWRLHPALEEAAADGGAS